MSEKIKDRIKERVAANNLGEKLQKAGVPEAVSPWFVDSPAVSAATGNYVLLSALVPNWKKSKAYEDMAILVHDAEEFPENVRVHIPEIDPNYRPNLKSLCELAYAIEQTNTNILLTGLPSVGKSSLVKYYCALTKRPLYRFNYNGTMDSSSILGTFSARNGTTEWHDGFLTEGIQVPYAVLLHDEWTTAPPETMMSLQNVLELNGYLILPDKPGSSEDKIVRPAGNVRHVFADNTKGNGDVSGKFVGTQPQNTATLDRIGSFIQVDFLDIKDEIAMLKASYPAATDKLLEAMCRVANLARGSYTKGDLSVVMSARVLFSWVQHSLNLKDYMKGLEIAYLNRFDSPSEQEAIKAIVETVFGR